MLGHAERAFDAESLVDVIKNRQDEEENADSHADGENQVGAEGEDLEIGKLLNGDDLSEPAGDGRPTDEGDEDDLEQVEEQLGALWRKPKILLKPRAGLRAAKLMARRWGLKLSPTCMRLTAMTRSMAPANSGKSAVETRVRQKSICTPTRWVPRSDSEARERSC